MPIFNLKRGQKFWSFNNDHNEPYIWNARYDPDDWHHRMVVDSGRAYRQQSHMKKDIDARRTYGESLLSIIDNMVTAYEEYIEEIKLIDKKKAKELSKKIDYLKSSNSTRITENEWHLKLRTLSVFNKDVIAERNPKEWKIVMDKR